MGHAFGCSGSLEQGCGSRPIGPRHTIHEVFWEGLIADGLLNDFSSLAMFVQFQKSQGGIGQCQHDSSMMGSTVLRHDYMFFSCSTADGE